MSARQARFTFTVDIDELIRKAKAGEEAMIKLGASSLEAGTKAETGMSRVVRSTTDAGNSATTAAVRFQTFSQGLLNLSTASAQTYTSISNLARADHSAAMAVLTHQRALTSLHSLQVRYQRAIDSGRSSTEQLAVMEEKIADARERVRLAAEGEALAEDQANDVKILFASSIANTVVSSLQTIKTMRDLQIGSAIREMLAQKALNAAMIESIPATGATVAGTTALAPAQVAATGTTMGLAGAFRGLTAAMMSNPLGWILIGASIAALAAYEANLGGIKTSIEKLGQSFTAGGEEVKAYTGTIQQGGVMLENYGTKIDATSAKLGLFRKELQLTSEQMDEMNKEQDRPMASIDSRFDADFQQQRRNIDRREKLTHPELGVTSFSDLKAADNLFADMNEHFNTYIRHGYQIRQAANLTLDEYKAQGQQLGFNTKELSAQLKITERLNQEHFKMTQNRAKLNKKKDRDDKVKLDIEIKDLEIVDGRLRTISNSMHDMVQYSRELQKNGWFDGKIPMSGYFNLKTGFKIDTTQDVLTLMQYEDLLEDQLENALETGDFSGYKQAVSLYNNQIRKLQSARNITSSYGPSDPRTRIMNMISKPIDDYFSLARKLVESGKYSFRDISRVHGNFGNAFASFGQTTANYYAEYFSRGRLSTPSAVDGRGFTSAGLTAARLSGMVGGTAVSRGGNRSAGRSSKHGGANRLHRMLRSQMAEKEYAQNLSVAEDLAQFGFNIPVPSLEVDPSILRGYRSPSSEFYTNAFIQADQRYSLALTEFNSRVKQAIQSITDRAGSIGESYQSYRQIYFDPMRGRQEIDDRVRYRERLGAISTGLA